MICAEGEWWLSLPILTGASVLDVILIIFQLFCHNFIKNSLHCKTCQKLLLFFEILSTLRQKKNTCLHNLHNANSSSKEKRYFLLHFRVAVHQNPRLQQSHSIHRQRTKVVCKIYFWWYCQAVFGHNSDTSTASCPRKFSQCKISPALGIWMTGYGLSGQNAQNGDEDVS